MSKADNIEDILLAATRLFAVNGYDNTSLRQIAQGAGVGLGTVNLYFTSKENLFLDVIARVIKELTAERRAMLDRARASGLTVENVLEASIWPVASRVVAQDATEHGKPYLVRWALQGPARVEAHVRKLHNPISATFVDALVEALPGLSRADAVSGYAVLISTTYSRHLLDQRYVSLLEDRPSPQDWVRQNVRRVVGIVAGGLRSCAPALAEGRTAA